MLLLSRFIINGHSMEPTIKNDQTVFVSKIPYLFFKPKVGDVVGFRQSDKVFIKRIFQINEEKYFLKGDNEDDSWDSRRFGWIARKDIVGKVIIKISNS